MRTSPNARVAPAGQLDDFTVEFNRIELAERDGGVDRFETGITQGPAKDRDRKARGRRVHRDEGIERLEGDLEWHVRIGEIGPGEGVGAGEASPREAGQPGHAP